MGLMLSHITCNASIIIIPPPPTPPKPPSPPPTPKEVIVVDDDGLDCPNADIIGRDALRKALEIVVDNGTIIACSGVYGRFTNAIREGGRVVGYKSVIIKGNGTVRLTMYYDSVGDIIFENVEIVVRDRARFDSSYTRVYNSKIILEPYWCTLGHIILRASSDEVMFVNTTIVSRDDSEKKPPFDDRPVIDGNPTIIVFNNTYIDVAVEVEADYVMIVNSTKTSKGSREHIPGAIMDPGCGIWFHTARPSIDIRGKRIVIEHTRIMGTAYIRGDELVFRHNIVEPHGFNVLPIYEFRSLWHPFDTGYDGIIIAVSNYTIEFNVFRNYVPNKPSSDDVLWGAVRVLSGNGVIRRNLFYKNDVGLIIDGFANPLVYDNLFIANSIHAASTMSTHIASIDPPRDGPNVIGGPLLGGNYWDDYFGPDIDGDGLGDIPYVNDYNVVDIHPLVPWSPYKCPPYMGGSTIATPKSALVHPSYIPVLSTIGLLGLVVYRRRRGLSGFLGLGVSVVAGIVLVLLVGQIAFTTSTSALNKTASPLVPIGTPTITNSVLHLTLYNPGSTRVCVEYGIVNGTVIQLYPVVGYGDDILLGLAEDILSTGCVNVSTLLEYRFIEPKHARMFKAVVPVQQGVVELDVVANNGVWRMYVVSKN